MINQAETILFALLSKLRQEQLHCPYCGNEKIHDNGCVLDGLWFDWEKEPIRSHLDD